MNQLADFNQICMDITFGHDKKIKPKSVCLHVISWTIGWNVTKFASLYKSERVNSLLDFVDLDLIFKISAS